MLDLKFVVRDPDGFQAQEQRQVITVPSTLIRRVRFAAVVEFSGSKAGVWSVLVLAAKHAIGEFSIEIRVPSEVTAS